MRVSLGTIRIGRAEDTVTRVQMAVDIVREPLVKCVHDSVSRNIVRVTDVIDLQLSVYLLDPCHRLNASVKSAMYWSAVDHVPIRRRFSSSTMSYLS